MYDFLRIWHTACRCLKRLILPAPYINHFRTISIIRQSYFDKFFTKCVTSRPV